MRGREGQELTTKTDFVLPSGAKVKGSFDFSQPEMVQGAKDDTGLEDF